MRCFPGASICNIPHYPSRQRLQEEFGRQIPDVCFVDAITDRASALSLIPEILQMDSRINLIGLIAANETDLILKCLRLGATEFLQQPFEPEQLLAALPKLTRGAYGEPGQIKLAKTYCVMPAKGACGASTMACNLAFQWKRLGFHRILLADMDPLTGTLSFLLKINSAYSFADVLQRAETLDSDLWKAMVTSRNGVDVLLSPEFLMHGIGDLQDASPVIDFARRNYEIVILDAGSAYGQWSLSQARSSDEVLLVTTNELPALHGAQRSISYLDANRVPRSKLRVIINRFDKKIGLSAEMVASALHVDVVHTIPSDYQTVQKALIDGTPIPHNSALGKVFAELGDKLAGRELEPPSRIAPLGGLLSLFGRTFCV